MAAALAVLLPRAAELGHDTLSDSLGLMCTFLSLWLAALALRRGDWRFAAAAGLAGRRRLPGAARSHSRPRRDRADMARRDSCASPGRARSLPLPALLLRSPVRWPSSASYAAVKGEISEKLALRLTAVAGPIAPISQRPPQQLPHGLDDPHWDFSPKEEGERIPIHGAGNAVGRIVGKWWEELCWLFAVMTVWGLGARRFIRGLCPARDPGDSGAIERRLLADLRGRLQPRAWCVIACCWAIFPAGTSWRCVCVDALGRRGQLRVRTRNRCEAALE